MIQAQCTGAHFLKNRSLELDAKTLYVGMKQRIFSCRMAKMGGRQSNGSPPNRPQLEKIIADLMVVMAFGMMQASLEDSHRPKFEMGSLGVMILIDLVLSSILGAVV